MLLYDNVLCMFIISCRHTGMLSKKTRKKQFLRIDITTDNFLEVPYVLPGQANSGESRGICTKRNLGRGLCHR